MELTFILIKPDAVARALTGEIIAIFEKKGFRIVALKMLQLTDKQVAELYPSLASKSFFLQVKSAMQCAPCLALALAGHEAVRNALILCGTERNPEDNAPGSIRNRFAMWTGADVVHRAKTREEADAQIAMFFGEEELLRYERADSRFLSEEGWTKSD